MESVKTKFGLLFFFYRFMHFLNLTTRANKRKTNGFHFISIFQFKIQNSHNLFKKDGKLLKSNWRPNKRNEVGTFQCNCVSGGLTILKRNSDCFWYCFTLFMKTITNMNSMCFFWSFKDNGAMKCIRIISLLPWYSNSMNYWTQYKEYPYDVYFIVKGL